jgi:integrase
MNAIDKRPYELFQRSDSPNWWMRFSLAGHGQKRISLKTPDAELARVLAEKAYNKAVWSAEAGVLEGKTSFSKLAEQYLGRLDTLSQTNPKHRTKYHHDKGIIDRYLVPYFGKKTVTSITHARVQEYLEWRRQYWTTGPGKDEYAIKYERDGKQFSRPVQHIEPALSTLRREAVTLRNVFKLAVTLGYLKAADIPAPELATAPKNKRPSFTYDEINKLSEQAIYRVYMVGKPDDRNKNYDPEKWTKGEQSIAVKVRFERMMLWGFIQIAVHTGMRPTELHNLTWANIEGLETARKTAIKDARIRIVAYGKGKSPQRLVPNVEALGAFVALWDAFKTQFGRAPEPTDAVFVNIDGQRAQNFKKSLNSLLEATGLKQDAFGRARTAHSFRHTYATNQLRKGTDIYTLAINMRTSVRMIEMYYSDVVPDDVAKRLEGSF